MRRITTRDSWTVYRDMLEQRTPFTTHGSMRGEPGRYPGYEPGILPRAYWDSARQAVYTVYSYTTPIAWVDANGTWTVPNVRYSVTTTRHQGKVLAALHDVATIN